MRQCPLCGKSLLRVHRTSMQKLVYADVLRCQCGYGEGRVHHALRPPKFVSRTVRFLWSSSTRCIKCGSPDVHRLTKRDRVDSMSKHVLSRLFRLTLAPINKCSSCRLQWYDWRPIKPRTGTTSLAQPAPAT